MDPAVAYVATALGAALINAIGTDSWVAIRRRVSTILGGGDPARTAHVERQLDADRDDVEAGRTPRDTAVGRWQGRLGAYLERHPEHAPALLNLIEATMRDQGPREENGRKSVWARFSSVHQGDGNITKINFGGILIVVAVAVVLALAVGWGTKAVTSSSSSDPRLSDLVGMWEARGYTGSAGEHYELILLAFGEDGGFTLNFQVTSAAGKKSGAQCTGVTVVEENRFTLRSTAGGCNPLGATSNGRNSLQLSGGSLPTQIVFTRTN